MKKRIISFMLTLVMVFVMLPMPIAKASGNLGTVQVAAGYWHSLAIKDDGSLWAWGRNWAGELGDGTTTSRSTPIKVMNNVQSVSAGWDYALAIKDDGSLWTWGNNGLKVMDNVHSAAAGYHHSLAIKYDGSLWAWGSNMFGELGDGTTMTIQHTPIKIMDNVQRVAAGSYHSLAIKDDGSLWAWGSNWFGELGDGTTTDRHTPIKVMNNVHSVSAGEFNSLAIKDDGSLWAWGANHNGQLGDGTTTNRSSPIKVMDNVHSVEAGDLYSLAIKDDGSLWAWGRNNHGQLGDGTTTTVQRTPIKIMDNVQSVAAGSNHSLAIKDDGSLWTWGRNDYGYLGDGTTTDRHSPIMIWGAATPNPSDNIEFTLSSVYANPGDQVEIVVRKNGGPGISSYHINLEYDENVLTPISVENNASGMFERNYDANDGKISMVWVGSGELSGSSDLATITFAVKNTTPLDSTTEIQFQNIKAINNEFKNLNFTSVDGAVYITGNLFGDVNEDGVVDSVDLILLMQYLAGKATLTPGGMAYADCYPDSEIDIKDAQMIARYLNGDPGIMLGEIPSF